MKFFAQKYMIVVLATTAVYASGDADSKLNNATPKAWNFMAYMCNNNNLHKYAVRNFQQMTRSGSSSFVNSLLQMDVYGQRAITRYYIERYKPKIAQEMTNTLTSFSGTPKNLYEFVQWGIKNYPAEKICLVLSNHGTGIKDPHVWGRALMQIRDKLFVLNSTTGLLELDRKNASNKSFLRALENNEKDRGIAFNEEAQVYLTNEDLRDALGAIKKDLLKGKKIDVLALDACYMAMIEIASQVKNSALFMVGSQEVEPGTGYNYQFALEPLMTKDLTQSDFASHLVASYGKEYMDTVGDFTQSAINLSHIDDVEIAINHLSATLIELLTIDQKNALKILKDIRLNKSSTTEFLDTDYIDLMHFLQSFVALSNECCPHADKDAISLLDGKNNVQKIWSNAREVTLDCIAALERTIIANTAGRNLGTAHGLSIYFPKTVIRPDYYKTEFAKTTMWPVFLKKFLSTFKKNTKPVEVPGETSLDSIVTTSGSEALCKIEMPC
ncbi:MAG: clostripain-related cysteine peptidase [Candidatus Babeliales bacterium]|jgi:hypothetical protein